MNLSIVDRLIIVNSMLPETGTIQDIKVILSLKNKIGFTQTEMDQFSIFKPYNNIVEINNITSEMSIRSTNYDLTEDEINMLKRVCEMANTNG